MFAVLLSVGCVLLFVVSRLLCVGSCASLVARCLFVDGIVFGMCCLTFVVCCLLVFVMCCCLLCIVCGLLLVVGSFLFVV